MLFLHLSFVHRNYVDDLSCKYLCAGITYAKLIFGKLNLLYGKFFIKMFQLFPCNWPYFRILSLNFFGSKMFPKDYFILSCILKFFLKTNSFFQKNYLQWTPYILSNFYSQEVFMPIDGYRCIRLWYELHA